MVPAGKVEYRLAKFDGPYEPGKQPVEVIEWNEAIPFHMAKKILDDQKKGE